MNQPIPGAISALDCAYSFVVGIMVGIAGGIGLARWIWTDQVKEIKKSLRAK